MTSVGQIANSRGQDMGNYPALLYGVYFDTISRIPYNMNEDEFVEIAHKLRPGGMKDRMLTMYKRSIFGMVGGKNQPFLINELLGIIGLVRSMVAYYRVGR